MTRARSGMLLLSEVMRMAQRAGVVLRRARLLGRRYGWAAKGSVAVVCVLMVVLACAAVGAFGWSGVTIERSDQGQAESKHVEEGTGTTGSARVLVHVDGAVARPGVYEIEAESPRVNDAVSSAGGLVDGADTSGMNLAAPVSDGEKVHVPTVGEEAGTPKFTEPPNGQGPVGADGGRTASDLVNINTASEVELQALDGVGEATASAIVRDRTSNGPYASPEDLMRVTGIGEKKFEKLKDQICV